MPRLHATPSRLSPEGFMGRRRQKQSIERALGARLRSLREQQGLSQAELARRAKISQSNVGRIEEGERSCTVGSLARLAAGLGVEPAALLSDLGEIPKPARAEKVFFRLCGKLRDRDERFLRAVEDLTRALERVTE